MPRKRKRSPAPPHLLVRVRALQQRVREWNAAAVLISNPVDVRYLTGFVGDDSWALITSRSSTVYILSDFRFEQQIQREAPHATAIMRKGGMADELAKLVRRCRLWRVALQSGHVSLAIRKALVKSLGARRVVHVEDRLIHQRAVKDQKELSLIRRAASITQAAFRETIAQIKPGQSEQQICALLEYTIRHLGANGVSFPSVVAVDGNASLPHAIPGLKKVRAGGIILIDWGAKFGGYCADLTRVIALGSMPSAIKKIYAIVLEAQLAAIEVIAPGVALKQVDQVARDIITKAGYGEQFGHSLGHGIGLDIHEQPVLAGRSEGVLEPGHVVTVEPGIYLPGVGGVRIEDDVLVTARGRRVLTDLPKTLESAII